VRKRLLLWTIAAIPIVYACDYVSVRYRIPGNREQTGTVATRREYAVKQKNKKTEFYFDPPRDETCSHSLFPQLGYPPCWYLERHKIERVEL
jgi:hypothetical protein